MIEAFTACGGSARPAERTPKDAPGGADLGPNPKVPQYVVTAHGLGYKFAE